MRLNLPVNLNPWIGTRMMTVDSEEHGRVSLDCVAICDSIRSVVEDGSKRNHQNSNATGL